MFGARGASGDDAEEDILSTVQWGCFIFLLHHVGSKMDSIKYPELLEEDISTISEETEALASLDTPNGQ